MSNTSTDTIMDEMTDEELRQELSDVYGVAVHHKTGRKKLISILADSRAGTYVKDESSVDIGSTAASKAAVQKALDAQKDENLTPEQLAMKLVRIIVTPNDPLMASHAGLIFTVGASGINNGEMVKKYVPFNNEEGWHVPNIIYNQIRFAEMQKFRTVTAHNGEKVLEPYITKKFNVTVLPDLSVDELKKLAASQQAAGLNVGVN
ncbi:hypothetical protein OAW27_00215 [bacterium]|nr:hypothetical protein [bacterium]